MSIYLQLKVRFAELMEHQPDESDFENDVLH